MATASVAATHTDQAGPAGLVTVPPMTDAPAGGFNPKGLVVIADVLAVVLGATLATALYLLLWGELEWQAVPAYAVVTALSLPAWVIGFVKNRLYNARFITRGVDETRRVLRGVALGVVGMALASVVIREQLERGWFVVVFVMTLGLVAGERALLRRMFDRWRMAGRLQRRVLVVGDNDEAERLFRLLSVEPRLGYLPIGQVSGDVQSLAPVRGLHGSLPARGEAHDKDVDLFVTGLLHRLEVDRADSVLIAASAIDLTTSNALIRRLTDAGIHVELSSTLLDVAPERLTVRPLGGFPIVYLEPVRRDGWRALAKRTFDVLFAGTLLLLTSPVIAISALAVRLTSPGPAFFRQTRVGRDGTEFKIIKLRTMVVDAEARLADLATSNESGGPLFKMKHDPRVTRVGRVLRSTSIDELPQLWNVLRGQMSMVGPRPALPNEVSSWPAHLHQRLRVQPGLTGMWQVSGRSSTAFEDYVRLDLYYVDNWSLLTDLLIVARTVPALLSRNGAF